MSDITSSQYNMYKALIALVWADGKVADEERSYIETFLRNQHDLTFDQRDELLEALDHQPDIDAIWDQITEVQDRAFLLDMASAVFYADGEYSIEEKQLYNRLLEKHLATLDEKKHRLEVARLQEQARISTLQNEEAYQQELAKGEAAGSTKIEKWFKRIGQVIQDR